MKKVNVRNKIEELIKYFNEKELIDLVEKYEDVLYVYDEDYDYFIENDYKMLLNVYKNKEKVVSYDEYYDEVIFKN